MQTAANYHIYMEMEGARMIQKEKIRGVGSFLMALAAGLLPFAAPDACAQALREGLALCGGPLLLSLFPFLIVSTLLIQCPAADVLGLPFCPVARLIGVRAPAAGRVLLIGSLAALPPQQVPPPRPSAPGSSPRGRPMRSFRPVSVPARPL